MTITNFNSSYDPIHIVEDMHHLPHLDHQLQVQSSTFDITYDSQWNAYTRSLLGLPAILLAIGLLAVIIFQCSLCFRACVPVCKCLPKVDQQTAENNVTIDQSKNNSATIPGLRNLYIAFFLFVLLAVAADQTIIFGSNSLVDGVQTSDDAINYMQNMFNGLVSYGDTLYTDGETLDVLFTEAIATNCSEAQQLADELPTYFEYVDEYQGYVDPVPDQCSTASDQLHKYGTEYKNSSMWALYGTVLLGVALYLVGLFLKSKLMLQLSLGFVQLLMLTLFILCAVEMVFLMGLADFCMEPTLYVQTVVPPSVQNITSYYATCVGTNPLDPSLAAAQDLIDSGEVAIQGLLANQCKNNSALQQALSVMGGIDYVFSNITAVTACPPTQSQFNDVLNTGLCEESYRGLYLVWLGQYLSTFFLFVATILVSFLYQYFNPHWDVDQQSQQGSSSSRPNSSLHHGRNSGSNLLFMENNPADADSAASTSPNEFYYSTSTMHTSGQYDVQKSNIVPDDSL